MRELTARPGVLYLGSDYYQLGSKRLPTCWNVTLLVEKRRSTSLASIFFLVPLAGGLR